MDIKKYFAPAVFLFSFILLAWTSYPAIGWWDSGMNASGSENLGIPGPGGSVLLVSTDRFFAVFFQS